MTDNCEYEVFTKKHCGKASVLLRKVRQTKAVCSGDSGGPRAVVE